MAKNKEFLIALIFCFLTECFTELSVEECAELGFLKPTLTCDTCDKFDEFNLQVIKPQCLDCCTQTEGSTPEKRYPKAVLEVCTCKFRAYPQIEAFIKSGRPAKFPNLQIKYVRGLDPMIKLYDAKDKVVETLSITKWNTDTVEEFFETHLKKVGSKNDAFSIVEDEDADDDEDFLKTNAI